MMTVSLSSSLQPSSFYHKHLLSLKTPPPHQCRQLHLTQKSSFLGFNSLRVSVDSKELMNKNHRPRGFRIACYSAPLSPPNLQWICSISAAVLMLARGTAIQKSFLVPLFALQAPASIVSWIKGEYGMWSAFLALLVRLFFFIPGELELPFIALLVMIVAPYQVMDLRGRQEGVILSLAIAGYLAFQHFSRAANLRKAFDQGSIIATLAVVCCVAAPCLLLI
ncbi:hypothetical protein LguiA_014848 [Lonicera macranthoides]